MSTGKTFELGRGLGVALTDVHPEMEEEYHQWYDEEHFPERAALDGWLWGQRYRLVEGDGIRFLALYGLREAKTIHEQPYTSLGVTPWSKSVLSRLPVVSRSVYEALPRSSFVKHAADDGAKFDLGRGVGVALTDVHPEMEEEYNRWYDEEHFPERAALDGWLWGQRYRLVEGDGIRYLAIYGLREAKTIHEEPYISLGATPWSKSVLSRLPVVSRSVYEYLPPSSFVK
jgi:hypothetical protein